MATMVKKSVIPFYLAAAVWLVFGFALPFYRVTDYVLCALISLVVFIVGKTIFPDKAFDLPGQSAGEARTAESKAEQPEEKKEEEKSTGDAELDKLVAQKKMAISELRRLNEAIPDEKRRLAVRTYNDLADGYQQYADLTAMAIRIRTRTGEGEKPVILPEEDPFQRADNKLIVPHFNDLI